ncbi:39S ribosomal protein L17, mitochondrial-like [Eriocheir sinensis]|uniref:39S ribosomal protein L17, mitochondrial-like n=1 Tax=Eriocheir sinensis TaxID=95602 RepID=UPI0021C925FA|nr:39S ribosomal protein L17, mitochondrial-like [Eriocheir sinensis]
MNQAEIRKLIPAVRVAINSRYRRFSNPKGPEGRLLAMRKTVTALVRDERIELNYHRADEARGYAERLIASAARYGDCHTPTMELADYWLLEKPLVHKLFKVLAERYKNHTESYTKLHKAPNIYPGYMRERAVLELKGNPFPPLEKQISSRNWIHNILLEEAHQDYIKKKLKEQEDNN